MLNFAVNVPRLTGPFILHCFLLILMSARPFSPEANRLPSSRRQNVVGNEHLRLQFRCVEIGLVPQDVNSLADTLNFHLSASCPRNRPEVSQMIRPAPPLICPHYLCVRGPSNNKWGSLYFNDCDKRGDSRVPYPSRRHGLDGHRYGNVVIWVIFKLLCCFPAVENALKPFERCLLPFPKVETRGHEKILMSCCHCASGKRYCFSVGGRDNGSVKAFYT